MITKEQVIGKLAIWYEDELNFGISRIVSWHPDGGVLQLESGMCFDTQLIAIIDEVNRNKYGEITILVEESYLSTEKLQTNI